MNRPNTVREKYDRLYRELRISEFRDFSVYRFVYGREIFDSANQSFNCRPDRFTGWRNHDRWWSFKDRAVRFDPRWNYGLKR
jgi:hypothetical protein